MIVKIENIKENSVNLLRRIGYTFQRHSGEQMSFVRSLSRSGFPRFHIYAKMENNNLLINIHLDRKKETYGQSTRHHGEYENDGVLQEEVERIKNL